jgi:hypothetical protein
MKRLPLILLVLLLIVSSTNAVTKYALAWEFPWSNPLDAKQFERDCLNARTCGFDAFAISLWEGYDLASVEMRLEVAERLGFPLCPMIDAPNISRERKATQVKQAVNQFFGRPGCLKINGEPVIVLYLVSDRTPSEWQLLQKGLPPCYTIGTGWFHDVREYALLFDGFAPSPLPKDVPDFQKTTFDYGAARAIYPNIVPTLLWQFDNTPVRSVIKKQIRNLPPLPLVIPHYDGQTITQMLGDAQLCHSRIVMFNSWNEGQGDKSTSPNERTAIATKPDAQAFVGGVIKYWKNQP